MIAEGLAWLYENYLRSEKLAALEAKAKASRVGLWADLHPEPPWEYRQREHVTKVTAAKPIPKVEPEADVAPASFAESPSTSSSDSSGTVHVRGYYRKNGTYVQPYTRRSGRR